MLKIKNKHLLLSVIVCISLTACGGSGSNEATEEPSSTPEHTNQYTHEVINNQGKPVESKLGKLNIKLYSNVNKEVDSKIHHVAVVVNLNGKDTKTMPIQANYIDEKIMVAVYDEKGKLLVKTDDGVEITDDTPVVVIKLKI
jgi:hypothetical protein